MIEDNPGYVYFVSDGEAIKIGFSERPERRLNGLQSGHRLPLKILAVVPATVTNEQELHKRFAHLHIRGEWFRSGPELTEYIATLGEPQGPSPTPPKEKKQPIPPNPFKVKAAEIQQELATLEAKYPTLPVQERCKHILDALKRIARNRDPEAAIDMIGDCLEQLDQIAKDGGEFIIDHHKFRHPGVPRAVWVNRHNIQPDDSMYRRTNFISDHVP